MGLAEELEKLQTLRDRGAISEEEYQRAKAQVLDDTARMHADTHKSFLRQLSRSRTDRYIGGVCGGLGMHTDLPSWAWRVIFSVITLYFGSGILFYVLLWMFLPPEPEP